MRPEEEDGGSVRPWESLAGASSRRGHSGACPLPGEM